MVWPLLHEHRPLPIRISGGIAFAEFRDAIAQAVAESEKRIGYLNDLPAGGPDLRATADCGSFPIRLVRSTEADELTARRTVATPP